MPHPQNDLPSSALYLPKSGPGSVASFADPDGGMPRVHLVEQVYGGRTILRFCHDDTGRLMTATDTRLRKVGLWAVELRGQSHHKRANKAGDFSPGRSVRLVREPSNPFDSEAIGVAAAGSAAVVGYLNPQASKRVAAILDDAERLRAVTIEGDPPGSDGRVVVLLAEPQLVEHVFGPRPADAAKPAHWL